VLRRLKAIKRALRRKPLNVSEANRALNPAVSKIVMDTAARDADLPLASRR
jgi:hypothetical protein